MLTIEQVKRYVVGALWRSDDESIAQAVDLLRRLVPELSPADIHAVNVSPRWGDVYGVIFEDGGAVLWEWHPREGRKALYRLVGAYNHGLAAAWYQAADEAALQPSKVAA